ncbi:MAG: RNA-binding transcriptional accessory protein [Butyrivibrio sp.]|nr:RNA-binding transcriptional accessory protein [Butyrivibrio sp.]
MDIIQKIADELQVRNRQVAAAVKLIDEGNTVPFIARYRKEATGSLNDEQLRTLAVRLEYLRSLEEKKTQVLSAIEEQGKLTEELRAQIFSAETLVIVEDIYRPYRPKRKTRASVAKEKGLEGLAGILRAQTTRRSLAEEAQQFINEEKGVSTVQDAIQGAMDILAEEISDQAEYRAYIREETWRQGRICSSARDAEAESVYEMYYSYEEPVNRILGHRILALNRGEAEKILSVRITVPKERILSYLEKKTITGKHPELCAVMKEVCADAYDRLIAPAIEREIRNRLTETAEENAIAVFGKNLKQLLMQPPVAGKTVLGWDPAFRTGCKLAVVDPTGKVLATRVIYPTAPQNRVDEAKAELKKLISEYQVDLISVGNGTASRESEQIIAALIRELERPVQYVIVNEAGASVYSASKLGAEEFPQFDVSQRSAASIARRLQDPLAELVKIDPQSIGVGQYQHDMNQKKLSESLSGVVEDCVNRVGVDLNTASAPLLSYISGISKTLAKNIVAYREANGRFESRDQLLKVPKLGPKAFEQCAGFLRIHHGKNPLDDTSVHPESYAAVQKLMERLGMTMDDTRNARNLSSMVGDRKQLAAELGIGEITLSDILSELEKPSRDPREMMPPPILRSDVMDLKDLKPGMILKGTVRNVVDFGAFVDIGVHQDGLVHISQISDRFIKHPLDAVSIGDIVEVQILDVDMKKQRISLTMKGVG